MNLFAFVGLIVSIASVFLGFYCLLNAQNRVHIIWSCFSFSVALWGLGIYKIALAVDVNSAVFWWRIAEIGVIFIPVLLTHFVLEFLGFHKNKFLFALYLLTSFFVFINLFTNYFFGPVRFVFGQFYYITSTPFYTLFIIAFLGLAIYDTFILYREYGRKEFFVKKQIEFFILAFIIGFSGGVTSFLPVYGIDTYPIFNFTIFISAILVSYSIFKYKLFNIKLLAAELLTFAIGAAVISQAVMADTLNGKILGGTTSVFVLIAGVFLIKSVKKEVAQREEIEQLAGRVKSVNRIMSHDIKNVLGKNKDMFGMLLDGSFGAVSEMAKPFLEQVSSDTKKLIRSVIVILESGRDLVLKPAPLDLKEAVLEVVRDEESDAKAKGLALVTNIDDKDTYTIVGDRTQLVTHVLRNLIENAIHYTSAGSITVGLSKKDANTVLFSVKDTGIGIPDADKPNMFKEGGHGKDSIKTNVHSTGYGLFSAKRIVDAHGGKVWFETEAGKGTTFWVELGVK